MNQKKTETELIQAVIKHFGIETVLDCIPKEKILDRVDADDCVRHFGSVDIAYSLYYSGDKDQLLDLYTFSELALAAEDKGDLKEWVDGINGLLTESGILRNGTVFTEAYAFSHDGLTNLLFPFQDGADIDFGRLAVWRLATHEQFGGTWLSDYIPNRLEDLEADESQDICQQCEM